MQRLHFHTDFTLNGTSFSSHHELLNYSKNQLPLIYSFLADWFDETDVVIVKTSGSTGRPKNVKLQKKHMVNSALATGVYFDLPAKSTGLLCLSPDFIAGKMMLVRALVLGWHLDVVEPNSNPLQKVKKHYDFAAMVPLQAYNSLDKLTLIKKLLIGGGVVSRELESKLQQVATKIYVSYGMTETVTHIAVKRLNKASFGGASIKMKAAKQSVGNTKQNTRAAVQLKNDVYHVLPDITISRDHRGCLVIDAPLIADQQVITNDLVEILSETEFKWLGRYDNIINSGGIKLIPEQIEFKLSPFIDKRFFVAGVPDAVLGEKLILVIEQDVISTPSPLEERSVILNEVKNLKTLTKYEVPKEIYFVSKFIETETKKIQRQQTLDLLFQKK